MQSWATAVFINPYWYGRKPVPSPGSRNIVFKSINLPIYPFLGGGQANQRQFNTIGAQNLQRLIGWVGPGGNLTGQVFNPPLVQPSGGGVNIGGVNYVPGSVIS